MKNARIDRSLGWTVAALAAVFVVSEFTAIDLAVQDQLYSETRGGWLVDAEHPVWRMLFYTGPKVVIIGIGVQILLLLVAPETVRARLGLLVTRRSLLVAFLTLASVPALIGGLKAVTNIFCPSEIRRYGGDVPYVRVVECYPETDKPTRRGRCFPAGHASGGFALFGMIELVRSRRAKRALFFATLAVGAAMGFYQMAKGAHYLSHTLVTALIAWICYLLWRRVTGVTRADRIGNLPSIANPAVLVLAFLLLAVGCSTVPAGAAASSGLRNFHQVNEAIYRGAQPTDEGILSLAQRGVKTIVDLREPDDTYHHEEKLVRGAGLCFLSVPMAGIGRPTNDQIEQVLALIEKAPKPVFIHCRRGADRTGTVIACYRIRNDGWSAERAIEEARRYDMAFIQFGMRDFIRDFEKAEKL